MSVRRYFKPANFNELHNYLSIDDLFDLESCRTVSVKVNKSFRCQLTIFKFPPGFQ